MIRRAACILFCLIFSVSAMAADPPDTNAPSALLMERETGAILMEKNAHEKLAPASVTKIMTLLLTVEAIDSGQIALDDMVTIRHEAGLHESSAFMTAGETYSVHELIKSVATVSANDGAVALAEYLAGSEEAFVALMNERAAQLSMNDTHFVNCTGLDAEGHLTSAWDIAIMSRRLLGHELIKDYTTIWIDSLREGTFQLVNTNRLVRFYSGTTGLKTGSTSIAKYCLSASAQRDGMELIAVVMAADTSDKRFDDARSLLDFGFAAYCLQDVYPEQVLTPVPVILGKAAEVLPELASAEPILMEKAQTGEIQKEIILAQNVQAPVERGQILGSLRITSDGSVLKEIQLVAADAVPRVSFFDVFTRLLRVILMQK